MTVAVISRLLEQVEEAVDGVLSLDHPDLVDPGGGDRAQLDEDRPDLTVRTFSRFGIVSEL